MTSLLELLQTLNAMHPIAIIAMLVLVLYYVVRNNTAAVASMQTLQDNHLAELPEMLTLLRQIAITLQRLEERQIQAIATVLERLK